MLFLLLFPMNEIELYPYLKKISLFTRWQYGRMKIWIRQRKHFHCICLFLGIWWEMNTGAWKMIWKKQYYWEFSRIPLLRMKKRNPYCFPWPIQCLHNMAPSYLPNLILYLLPHLLLYYDLFVFIFIFQTFHLLSISAPLPLSFFCACPFLFLWWLNLIIQVSSEKYLPRVSLWPSI